MRQLLLTNPGDARSEGRQFSAKKLCNSVDFPNCIEINKNWGNDFVRHHLATVKLQCKTLSRQEAAEIHGGNETPKADYHGEEQNSESSSTRGTADTAAAQLAFVSKKIY